MYRNPWLILVGVLLAAVAVLYLAGAFGSRVTVKAARATRQPIREFIDEQAKTRLPETHLVTMPFAGRIEAVALEEGSRVKQGQVVAQVVPSDLKLDVEQATAAVRRLEASLRENADVSVEETAYKQAREFVVSTAAMVQAAVERVKSGEAKLDYAGRYYRSVAGSAAKGAMTELDLAAANLQQLQSGYDLNQDKLVHAAMLAMQAATNLMPTMIREYIARKALSGEVLEKQKAEAEVRWQQALRDQKRGLMTSPVEGVVLNRFVTNERYLAAGASLVEIGRLEDLEVEAEILTLDVVAAKVGDAVEVYGPAIGRPAARGTVARIYPAGFTKLSSLGVEQQRVMVVVRFAPDDLDRMLRERRLGVGYRVRVKIFTAEKPQALVIPRSALFRATGGQWQVYAVRNGTARVQNIEIGLMNDEAAEVTAGLSEGEVVVLAPESTLSDGARVKAEE